MTDAENKLWSKIRRKQISGIQFYRQKPIGSYIVDFYAPEVKLVIEVDGSQHLDKNGREEDKKRDRDLLVQGLRVLRFDNLKVLKETEAVVEKILAVIKTQ